MKNKYLNLLWILVATLTLSLSSCSSDDDPVIENNETELTVSNDNVRVLVGETTTVDIVQGNGDYKAFSLNEEIATVEIVDSKLNINTYTNGRTSVVVSDKNSNYKNVDVVSYYGEIILEEYNVTMKMRIGNYGIKKIPVLGGNEGYVATSEDTDIASVTVDGNSIVVTGKKEGEVKIHVVDQLDVKTEFTITIETTDKAYEKEELDVLMKDASLRFFFDGNMDTSSSIVSTIEGNYNVYGWDYYGYEYQKVYFEGEKTVGKKENAVFTQIDWFNIIIHNKQPIELEIIKVDDGKIWGVFSFLKNEKLFYGSIP